tara:strand:+ start:70 stop:756 length:687 start_codon:yes stop_codon:yes gene_type:complete
LIWLGHSEKGKVLKLCQWLLVIWVSCFGGGCERPQSVSEETKSSVAEDDFDFGASIVMAARSQIGKTTIYDPAYVGLKYPGGDVPIERGVCTDVIVRALRQGLGFDLQKVVHEDMKKAFNKYPKIWGLSKTDRNIDHRRVPNLRRFFERKGWSLRVSNNKESYLYGDLVSCLVGKRPHIMIVSDKRAQDGTPLVIHNIGSGAKEENALFDYPITGHYRIKVEPVAYAQ